ncbi:MAG: transglutaminase-like cysteine peptidase [Pseudomonadota bacterium]
MRFIAIALLLVGCTQAPNIPESVPAQIGERAGSPEAYREFITYCQTAIETGATDHRATVDECREVLSVRLSNEVWEALERITIQVNQDVRYNRDQDVFDDSDFYRVARDSGDCEDYQLAKLIRVRKQLEDHIPRTALRLTSSWTDRDRRRGSYHIVLTVVTDRGDYILDNRFDRVMSPLELQNWHGYVFHKRETALSSTLEPGTWELVQPYKRGVQ